MPLPILPRLTSSYLFHSVSHLNGKFSNCRQTAHIQLNISHFDDNSRTWQTHQFSHNFSEFLSLFSVFKRYPPATEPVFQL